MTRSGGHLVHKIAHRWHQGKAIKIVTVSGTEIRTLWHEADANFLYHRTEHGVAVSKMPLEQVRYVIPVLGLSKNKGQLVTRAVASEVSQISDEANIKNLQEPVTLVPTASGGNAHKARYFLSTEEKELILDAIGRGDKVPEIAEVLGLKTQQVWSFLSRHRAKVTVPAGPKPTALAPAPAQPLPEARLGPQIASRDGNTRVLREMLGPMEARRDALEDELKLLGEKIAALQVLLK